MAQYRFTKIDIEDGSKSDFIANFGEKLANSFIKAMKNPNMPNACKNIDRWNKFYRLAKDGKLSNDDFYKFANDECKIDFYRDYYDDELPNENAIINLCSEVVKAYQSEEDSIEAQIEEICQMPEADNVRYLGEDNGWKCYEILSPEASVKYGLKVGGKAKWCISGGYFDGEKDVLEEAEHYFNQYKSSFDTYYFIIGHGTKFAICPDKNGYEVQIWDQKDNEVDPEAIPEPPLNIKELQDYLFTVNYDKVCDFAMNFVERWEKNHQPALREKLENFISNMLPNDYTDEQIRLYVESVKERLDRYHITVYEDIEEYYVSDDFKEVTPKEEYEKIINEPLKKEDFEGYSIDEIFDKEKFWDMAYRKIDLISKLTYETIMKYMRKEGYQVVKNVMKKQGFENAYNKFTQISGYEDALKIIQDYARINPLSFGEEIENPHFSHTFISNQNYDEALGGGYTSDFKSYLEHAKYIWLYCKSGYNTTNLRMYDDAESLAGLLGVMPEIKDGRPIKVVNQRADHDKIEVFERIRNEVKEKLKEIE